MSDDDVKYEVTEKGMAFIEACRVHPEMMEWPWEKMKAWGDEYDAFQELNR